MHGRFGAVGQAKRMGNGRPTRHRAEIPVQLIEHAIGPGSSRRIAGGRAEKEARDKRAVHGDGLALTDGAGLRDQNAAREVEEDATKIL